jgi:putative FmdB family regulatory protein
VPIFVYRCECGHRFERLVPRDADAPACPDCGGGTRKIPAGPSLRRGAQAPASRTGRSGGGEVPIPWRGVVSGGPEKLTREVEFRERLEAKAVGGLRVPGGPDTGRERRPGDTSSVPAPPPSPPA